MTPFGSRIRELRAARGVALKAMAQELGVSPAYLSALEHGRRGRPTYVLVMQICGYFQLIWDEAEELHRLARLSHPRVVIDTAGASAEVTLLANILAERIHDLDTATVRRILAELRRPPEDTAPKDMAEEKAEDMAEEKAEEQSP
jgi:transcriptional regulator with XRE-family HTH domain